MTGKKEKGIPAFKTSHNYAESMRPDVLSKRATRAVRKLYKPLRGRVPIFCYTGLSGIGAATALSLEMYRRNKDRRFGLIYVRKKGEQSHGHPVEYTLNRCDNKRCILVFVDAR